MSIWGGGGGGSHTPAAELPGDFGGEGLRQNRIDAEVAAPLHVRAEVRGREVDVPAAPDQKAVAQVLVADLIAVLQRQQIAHLRAQLPVQRLPRRVQFVRAGPCLHPAAAAVACGPTPPTDGSGRVALGARGAGPAAGGGQPTASRPGHPSQGALRPLPAALDLRNACETPGG